MPGMHDSARGYPLGDRHSTRESASGRDCCQSLVSFGTPVLSISGFLGAKAARCDVGLQVSLPGHICAVVMTTLVLEGWSSALDPHHSVLGQVDRVLALSERSWRRRVTSAVDHVLASSPTLTPLAL